MMNIYEHLGIETNATKKEITESFDETTKKFHINIKVTEESSYKFIHSLTEAKDLLLNDKKRIEYDMTIEEIKNSKQFSKNESETYKSKVQKYKKEYEEVNISKRELFINYIAKGKDSIIKKLIKTLIIIINLIVFTIIKGIYYGLLGIIEPFKKIIDWFVNFLILIAIIELFLPSTDTPNYISFIPANVEQFCIVSILAFILKSAKTFVVEKSTNVYNSLGKFENKVFRKIIYM